MIGKGSVNKKEIVGLIQQFILISMYSFKYGYFADVYVPEHSVYNVEREFY
jgi:hypothetical protein